MARVILLERVICFPCLSELRYQPIPALHIPCTAWNITFISMICHFHCCPRLFIYNTCRTSDGSAGAYLEQGRVYEMMGRSDPDCCVTVSVMFWFACFSVVFFKSRDLHKQETMVSEAHSMSFPCTELLLFNYAKVKTVFHSMAIFILSWSCMDYFYEASYSFVHNMLSLYNKHKQLHFCISFSLE